MLDPLARLEFSMFRFDRRSALIAGVLSAAALIVSACTGGGGSTAAAEGEMTLGSADAPITVVEYASVTCPHCAAWTEQVFPEFKRRYIDTGQVRYVFRELPTPPVPVAVAGFLTARCIARDDDERYFTTLEAMMRSQQALVTNPRQFLLDMARSAGMNEEQFDACVTDEAAITAMNQRVADAQAAGVTGTPYFFVNDQRHEDITLEGFEAALRPLIGGEAPAAAPAAPASAPPAAEGAADAADASSAAATPAATAPASPAPAAS